jgi:hypothetical protein
VSAGDELLQTGVVVGGCGAGRVEFASLDSFDRAQRMVRDRDDLETEGQHVGGELRIDDGVRIDVVRFEVRVTLVEEARDAAQRLQVVGDRDIVER